jgi:hypothetical protein
MEVSNYKRINVGALLGSFDVTIPEWGLTIHECKLFEKDGRKWVGFPSRQYETAKGEKKRVEYVNLNKESKSRFDAGCLKKLEALSLQAPTSAIATTASMPF